jgi:hypothetical protein
MARRGIPGDEGAPPSQRRRTGGLGSALAAVGPPVPAGPPPRVSAGSYAHVGANEAARLGVVFSKLEAVNRGIAEERAALAAGDLPPRRVAAKKAVVRDAKELVAQRLLPEVAAARRALEAVAARGGDDPRAAAATAVADAAAAATTAAADATDASDAFYASVAVAATAAAADAAAPAAAADTHSEASPAGAVAAAGAEVDEDADEDSVSGSDDDVSVGGDAAAAAVSAVDALMSAVKTHKTKKRGCGTRGAVGGEGLDNVPIETVTAAADSGITEARLLLTMRAPERPDGWREAMVKRHATDTATSMWVGPGTTVTGLLAAMDAHGVIGYLSGGAGVNDVLLYNDRAKTDTFMSDDEFKGAALTSLALRVRREGAVARRVTVQLEVQPTLAMRPHSITTAEIEIYARPSDSSDELEAQVADAMGARAVFVWPSTLPGVNFELSHGTEMQLFVKTLTVRMVQLAARAESASTLVLFAGEYDLRFFVSHGHG